MKIEYNCKDDDRLSSIEVGEVFEYDDRLFLKTDELSSLNSERICVCLEDGTIMLIDETDVVRKREMKIVVE